MTAITKANTSIGRSIQLSIPEKIKAKLTQSEFRIVSASIPSEKNPRISELDERQRLRAASTIVIKAETRLGSKDKDDLHQEALVTEIDSDLCKFPNLTTLEIFAALEIGLDGGFSVNNIVVFTPSNFVIWVNEYVDQRKRPAMKSFAQLNHQVEEIEYVPTIEDTIYSQLKVLELALSLSLPEGPGFQDYGGQVYALLDDYDYINLDSAQKWEYMRKASQVMLQDAIDANDTGRIKSLSALMQSTKVGVKHESVIATAQRLIVADKLKIICTSKEDAADFLENITTKINDFIITLNESETDAN